MAVTNRRYRYIAFIIHPKKEKQFHRGETIKALQNHCMNQFKTPCKTYGFFLTRFKHNTGILRCYHTEKERAISFLTSIKNIDNSPVSIETMGTSGTIKALLRKHLQGDTLKDS